MKWLVSCALLASASFGWSNLLSDHSFEAIDTNSFICYLNGQTFGDWRVNNTSSSVCVVDNAYTGGGAIWPDTLDGEQFCYLNDSVQTGELRQRVLLYPDLPTTLVFEQADFGMPFGTPGGQVLASLERVGVGTMWSDLYEVPNFAGFTPQSRAFTVPELAYYDVTFSGVPGRAGLIDNVILDQYGAHVFVYPEFEDRVPGAPAPTSFLYEFRDMSGGLVQNGAAAITSGGYAQIPFAAEGEYLLRVKTTHFLSKSATLTIGNSNSLGLLMTLKNGDVDGDNEVGPGDFGDLANAFLSVSGDPNWDPFADLDGDGEVGPGDFAILANNFLLAGD